MAYQDALLKVKAGIAPHLEQAGYVLVDLRLYRNQAGAQVLEVLVDRPDGGITLGECGTLNREIGALLDSGAVLSSRTLLDVSSPGLDRPLAVRADFRRAKGRRIRVFLSAPVEEKIEVCGICDDAGESALRLVLEEKTVEIPYDKINKAKQVVR